MSKKNKVKPVRVSGDATKVLATNLRRWSGWRDASLLWGEVAGGAGAAMTDMTTREFTVNIDRLLLNPNRVLLNVTPFRLRQEAVLTGAMLHEVGHARHSHWRPADGSLRHADGTEPAQATVSLATLMEEPRIEGMIAWEADKIGAYGLGWTMRASAAHLLPMTQVSDDPAQAVMDLIQSWALRAGRQHGLNQRTGRPLPSWVGDFDSLLHQTLVSHLEAAHANDDDPFAFDAVSTALAIKSLLLSMITCNDDDGPAMIEMARDVLGMLFPETPPEDQPQSGGSCSTAASQGEGEESQGQEGSEAAGTGAESAEQGSEGQEGEGEGSGPENADSEDDDDDEGSSASSSTDESEERSEAEQLAQQAMQQALADMEDKAQAACETEAKNEAKQQPMAEPGKGAGDGQGSGGAGGFRPPLPEERAVQKNAERFLRNLIDPTESAKVSLSESPSSSIDPAAKAAWEAGGQVRDPMFFRRTRREEQPSPPVKIGVLVDVSSSMSVLQKPSALLSWALASAAFDLRNFAGRGAQVESCLIHWGSSTPRVIQKNGQMLPGIREFPCDEGTSALDRALDTLEEQLPGFLDGDPSGKPVNRLLVQFTDWDLLGGRHLDSVTERIGRALASGVNMISVMPGGASMRRADLSTILSRCPVQRGTSSVLKYNPMFPEEVWDHAAEVLSGKGRPAAPFAGF